MKSSIYFTLSFLLVFTFIKNVESQTSSIPAKPELLKLSEKKYGLDELLNNGIKYYFERPNAKGSPFFNFKEDYKNKLYIKGQKYNNIKIRYDLVQEQLILFSKNNKMIRLQKELVDSFAINGYKFINLRFPSSNKLIPAYFELIFDGSLKLLKKYDKNFIKTYNNINPYGVYSKQTQKLYIYKSGELFKINSKRSFLKFFSENKKQIQKYIKTNNINLTNTSNQKLNDLMNFCNQLSKK